MTSWLVDNPQRLALDGDVDELHVWLTSGKLRVLGTDGPARIEVTKVGRQGVAVSLEEGVLSVRHEVPQEWWSRFGPFWWFVSGRRRYHAHVTIAVPPSAVSNLTMISGSVVASGLRHGATVDVTSGSITLMGLGGLVRAKTVSGSIQAMGVSGDLGLKTVSGEISLAESSAESVYAHTDSGSVTCDLDNPFARDVRLDTISGAIAVRVPEDADLDVNLGATSGRVTSAFREVQVSRTPGHNAARGRIGTGSGTLNAYAVSGSVSLLARASEDFSAPGETPGTLDTKGTGAV
jgi:hypothetical protein